MSRRTSTSTSTSTTLQHTNLLSKTISASTDHSAASSSSNMSYWTQPSRFEAEAEARFEQAFGLAPPQQAHTAPSQTTISQDRGTDTAPRFQPALQAIRRTMIAQEGEARAPHADHNGTPNFPGARHDVQSASLMHLGGVTQFTVPGKRCRWTLWE